MKIKQYYQSGRYSEDSTKWRKEIYFPLRTQWLIKQLPKKFSGKVLDAGCGDGGMLAEVKELHPEIEPYGVDISESGCRIAKERGINTKVANLNEKIPFKDSFFDFVVVHEVIEHLLDPDKFLEECNRTLKKRGYLVITTPNLAAWYHRILFLFGFYPLFLEMSTRDRRVGIGPLRQIIRNTQPVGHVRIFTAPALKDLVKLYGFRVERVKGSPIAFNFPKIVSWIYDSLDFVFSFFPSLSSNLLIVARKTKG